MDIEWESDRLFDTEPKVDGILKWSIKDASGATRGMFTVIPRDSGVLVMAHDKTPGFTETFVMRGVADAVAYLTTWCSGSCVVAVPYR